jgi:hypothetical protein
MYVFHRTSLVFDMALQASDIFMESFPSRLTTYTNRSADRLPGCALVHGFRGKLGFPSRK